MGRTSDTVEVVQTDHRRQQVIQVKQP